MDGFISAVTFVSRVAGVVGAFFIAAAVLIICDMVIERYIFNLTTIWQIDAVTYLTIAATFISSPYVLMTRGHVNVDILPLHLKPRARYVLALVTSFIALAFCVTLFVLCAAYWYEAYSERWLSNTVWRARLWIPLLSMPVGLFLLVLQYIVDIYCVMTGRTSPFGISARQDAEDVAREQAREALGGAP
ncbi:TRAP transporter small permease [Pseudolabrys taiwanensis]|uniref:TRAP transporter small permease protein n=1 Tax=Pseudolabrys taiwanensis TaxID=331696 RepID=A0A345ZX27_9HYPH|nr:TRAP transporter small permease subunit [Pseudolabrys taiwanensis]AXK81474.1 TRAP transporter small permease [Pseudolabrys taiwanensis]